MLWAPLEWARYLQVEFNPGQKILIDAAKYLQKRWTTEANINDKLAMDRLIWLVSEATEEVEHVAEISEVV
jgi:hypothetical protein